MAVAAALLGQVAQPQGSTPAVAPLTPRVVSPGGLALIVGIDHYAQPDDASNKLSPLRGAANDAARAKELLLGRFGFQPEDIVTLLGPAATHEEIVRNFYEHLIKRAGPETRVVIWFSGHGSRVPDSSKADAAVRNAHDANLDDTLLAYDSRKGKRDGSFDVTDDELHSLLAALPARDVVLVTDCCHSGGLLRGPATGGVRHAGAGTQPLDRELIRPFWPEAVPFHDDDRGNVVQSTVQIAACESTQEAGECEGGADRWYGTLTWFLAGALAEVDPATSWQTVAEIVRARVAACRSGTRSDQIVRCIGPGERAIFGGLGKPVPPGYHAQPNGARCRIEAGRIHGLVENSELQLVGLDGKDYGIVRVYRARATFCEADPREGRKIPVGVALRAIPSKGLDGRAVLRISCGPGVDPAVLEGCPWVVNTQLETADYVLCRRGDGLALQADGLFVREVPASPQKAQQELFFEHCFRSLWEGVAQPGRHRIGIAVKPWDAAQAAAKTRPLARMQALAGERRILVGAPYLPEERDTGAMVTLTVTNESREMLHVAVLSVAEDRAVTVIWGENNNNVLAAGRSASLDVELGPNPKWQRERPMVDRYVVIATPRYADFRPFESPAPGLTRGKLETGAMPGFLAGALTGSVTRGGNEAGPPAWGIQWLDLELVLPDRFDALTRK